MIDIRTAASIIAAGQTRVTSLLAGMLRAGKLPPSLLFSGPEGTGKELTAFDLAARLNCRESGCSSPYCPSCEKTSKLEHPDFHPVFPLPSGPVEKTKPVIIESRREDFMASGEFGGKARSIGIGQIRELIENAAKQPFEGRWSVVILFEAHMATTEAQNAFLKLLEEPPPSVVLIMTTEHPDRLLPTIRSRCQEIRFDILPDQVVADFIETFYSVEKEEAARLALGAGGNIRRAERLLDERFLGMRNDAAAILRLILEKKARMLPAEAEGVAREYTREETELLLGEMVIILRDLMRDDAQVDSGNNGIYLKEILGKTALAESSCRDIPGDIGKIEAASRILRRNVDVELTVTQLLLDLAGKWY